MQDDLARLRAALGTIEHDGFERALAGVVAPEAIVHLCHPIGDLSGEALFGVAYAPLMAAFPDIERRDWISVSGADDQGQTWIGLAGHFVGTFVAPWLDIPPTGHLTHMRFHEFYRIEGGRAIEIQAIWDIPEVMMQAGAWPMAPSLGRELFVPAPASQDGLGPHDGDPLAAQNHVLEMLSAMIRHPGEGGPEVMELERFWHPRFNWYGPAGVGSMRGVPGFRNWHQIPFLSAMPDRGQAREGTTHHFFAQGAYVAVTGWPNMRQTLTAGGWLGIAPAGQEITLRSLDFWRLEEGRIRENWVLFGVLHAYDQLNVDVLGRMREFNKARVPGAVPWPLGDP